MTFDKASYLYYYENFIIKNSTICILEIGVRDGASMRITQMNLTSYLKIMNVYNQKKYCVIALRNPSLIILPLCM